MPDQLAAIRSPASNKTLKRSPMPRGENRTASWDVDLSPEPILRAADGFRGSWVDLDRSLEIDAAAFARGWHRLSEALGRCGLNAGDRVVMCVSNGPLFPAALAAILERGGAPLLVHCETPTAELHRTANRFAARFILCDRPCENDLSALTSRVRTVSCENWMRVLWAELADDDRHGSSDFALLAGVPLHPTSGTTGHARVAARPGTAPWPKPSIGWRRWE